MKSTHLALDKLSDQRCTQHFQAAALQIKQTIHAIHIDAFRSRSRKDHVLCIGDSLSSIEMTTIVLDLTGQAPLIVRHNSQANRQTTTLKDNNTSTYMISLDVFQLECTIIIFLLFSF
jgi:nucleoporin POM152